MKGAAKTEENPSFSTLSRGRQKEAGETDGRMEEEEEENRAKDARCLFYAPPPFLPLSTRVFRSLALSPHKNRVRRKKGKDGNPLKREEGKGEIKKRFLVVVPNAKQQGNRNRTKGKGGEKDAHCCTTLMPTPHTDTRHYSSLSLFCPIPLFFQLPIPSSSLSEVGRLVRKKRRRRER